MRDVIVWVVGVCLLTLVAPLANAELITIHIEGVVDEVYDDYNYLDGQVNPGDIITGWYRYDIATPDSNPLDEVADYWYTAAPAGMFIEVQGYVFQTDWSSVDFLVEIADDYGSGSARDVYIVRSYNNLPLEDTMEVGETTWMLRDFSASALTSTELGATAPELSLWEYNWLAFGAGTKLESFSIVGHVTSAIAIPEPASLFFLTFGAVALVRKNG